MQCDNIFLHRLIHLSTYKFTTTLKIITIYRPYLYSIQYDKFDENEYDRLFNAWNDVSYVVQFITAHKDLLHNHHWIHISKAEEAAQQVLEEAEGLETLIETLCINTAHQTVPDLDSHFRYLEGKYRYELEYPAMKSYGTKRPSLLRMYAIKLQENCYLITGGGIKLADSIQHSPDLKNHILQNLDKTRTWLKKQGIIDSDDI